MKASRLQAKWTYLKSVATYFVYRVIGFVAVVVFFFFFSRKETLITTNRASFKKYIKSYIPERF